MLLNQVTGDLRRTWWIGRISSDPGSASAAVIYGHTALNHLNIRQQVGVVPTDVSAQDVPALAVLYTRTDSNERRAN
jgi:hypothetical protein